MTSQSAAVSMDPPERLVLRRKKLILSTHFNLTPELLNRIKAANLIKRADYDFIKSEPTNIGRVGRLVDGLPVEGFEFLCNMLEEQNEWVADELRAEMMAELGDLEIEDYISKEASVIVHREYGASKRLAEGDKARLCSLLALRTQFAKEVWRKQLQRTSEALNESMEENNEKDTRAELLAKKIEKFLGNNRKRMERRRPASQQDDQQKERGLLDSTRPVSRGNTIRDAISRPSSKASHLSAPSPVPTQGHSLKFKGPQTASDSSLYLPSEQTSQERDISENGLVQSSGSVKESRTSSTEQDPVPPAHGQRPQTIGARENIPGNTDADETTMKTFNWLHSLLDELLSLADSCATEKEKLRVERLRLLESLKVQPGDEELVQMDVRLKDLLQQAQESVDETTQKIKERDAKNKELEHQLNGIWIESEKAIELKDDAILQISKQLKEFQEKNRDLQSICMKLESETRTAKNELKQCKLKTASLERNRRLGYKPAGDGRQSSGSRFPAIQF